MCDDFFLGDPRITNHGKSVFDYWKGKLPEIFPSPVITKTPYISFGGCIGSGKSFISKMIGLYHYHRLDCCSNVFNSLGLAGGTKLAIGTFHQNVDTALADFVRFYKSVMDISPYFRKQYNNPGVRFIAASSKPGSKGVIGTQLIYCERLRSIKIISNCWKKFNFNQQKKFSTTK